MTAPAGRSAALVRVRAAALVPTMVLVTLVTSIVSSLGAPLVPEIAEVRGVSVGTAQFSLTAALLVGAVSNPLLGRLGAGAHRRTVILVGLALVALGCLVAALPFSFGWLLAGRALQGIGLALNPLAFGAVRAAIPEVRAAPVIALLAAINVAGGGLGYLVTGLIADHGGLAACFWVGVAVCVVTWVLVVVVVPSSAAEPTGPVDWWGAVLLGVGTAALLVVLSLGATWGWASWRVLGGTVVGLVGVVLWLRRSRRLEHPLVDLRLAGRPGALGAHVTALTVGTGMYVVMTTVVLVAQASPATGFGLGYSVAVAGALLLPYAALSILGSRVVVLVSGRVSGDGVLTCGCTLLLAGAIWLALLHSELWHLHVGLGLVGLGGGCTFSAMPAILVRAVPPMETSSAIAFNLVLRYLGFATGSALGGAVLDIVSGDGPTTGRAVTVGLWVGAAIWLAAGLLVSMLSRRTTRWSRLGVVSVDEGAATP